MPELFPLPGGDLATEWRVIDVWTARDIAMVMVDHASPGDTFTANNVWDWIGTHSRLAHPNATMGQAFRLVQGMKYAAPTGDIMQSTHPTRKRGMVRVWRWL